MEGNVNATYDASFSNIAPSTTVQQPSDINNYVSTEEELSLSDVAAPNQYHPMTRRERFQELNDRNEHARLYRALVNKF